MPSPAASDAADDRTARLAEQHLPPPAVGRVGRRLLLAALLGATTAIPAVLLLLAVRSQWRPAERLDVGVLEALHEQVLRWPGVAEALRVVALLTHPWALRVVALAVAVVLWRRGQRRLAGWLAVTMTLGGLLAGVLKILVHRPRPVLPDPVGTADGFSFPSGHALNSALLAAVLLVLFFPRTRGRRRLGAGLAAIGFVVLVGFDRVALGVHYVTDVLAAWFLALAVLVFTRTACADWRPARWRSGGDLSRRPWRRRP